MLLFMLGVVPGRSVGRRRRGAARIFLGHGGAGVCSRALRQAMAPAAPQAAVLTPLQAGTAAVIILRGTGDGR